MAKYIDKESYFQPGMPVSPEYFKGREIVINKILRQVNKASKGMAQHYFITGKKGIGKTSLAKYVQNLSEDKLLPVYVSNMGNDSLETLVANVFESILESVPKRSKKEKIVDIFSNIEGIQVKDFKLTFNPTKEIKKDFVNHFLYYLKDLTEKLGKGIFLVIDDLNGLSSSDNFLNWYKRLADRLAVDDNYNIPVYFLLASYYESFQEMAIKNESFIRIFHYDDIAYLSDGEVEDFYNVMFAKSGIQCNIDALKLMTSFSSGIPLMMQEIGEAVFWTTDTNVVTIDDAISGIIQAGEIIGNRQLKPVMDKSIRSSKYESILLKFGKYNIDSFEKKDFEIYLTEDEKKVFPNFLRRAVELNILESVGKDKSGQYCFSNKLYFVYLLILNLKNEKEIN